ncbi:TIGR02206 family membrane protein [Fictibacillus nanhaiensis]|uniref:YwaF family protein n=1 Tax=Fictibacillus nanhaiensis TaxID=742169 RepID=UPI00203B9DAD|nr:TIGR02206 family membrane protein [Fictibacillus nanhaiensis]MCM3732820.1 TIGR02206 family membrane protein [Fictibacillus nanhaiensis]
MEQWFNKGEDGFVTFGWEHIFSLSVIFVVVLFMYILRSYIREISYIKKLLFISLLLSEVSYQCWAIYNEMWTIKLYLPLQLCSFNIFLSAVLLVTENKKLFAFVYLFGFTGALQGLLTPELHQQAWHFRFIQFFIAHGLIVWTAMYFAIVRSFRISWLRFLQSFLCLNLYAAGVYAINVLLDTNYMFLMRKPGNASIMDYLGPYPWYILGLELVAFCMCLIAFLPVKEKSYHSMKKDHPPIDA